MAKKTINYFEALCGMVDYSCQAARMLHETLTHFDPDTLSKQVDELHNIEHAADVAKHEMLGYLIREFITPIEREDIMDLASEIDDVTDSIEDVLLKIYMYNIREIHPQTIAFSEVIVSCCAALRKAMGELQNFRKSTTIHEHLIEVNRLEEAGDRLYMQTLRELYAHSKDPLSIMIWTEAYDRLEKCCDSCEHVADCIEGVLLNNT